MLGKSIFLSGIAVLTTTFVVFQMQQPQLVIETRQLTGQIGSNPEGVEPVVCCLASGGCGDVGTSYTLCKPNMFMMGEDQVVSGLGRSYPGDAIAACNAIGCSFLPEDEFSCNYDFGSNTMQCTGSPELYGKNLHRCDLTNNNSPRVEFEVTLHNPTSFYLDHGGTEIGGYSSGQGPIFPATANPISCTDGNTITCGTWGDSVVTCYAGDFAPGETCTVRYFAPIYTDDLAGNHGVYGYNTGSSPEISGYSYFGYKDPMPDMGEYNIYSNFEVACNAGEFCTSPGCSSESGCVYSCQPDDINVCFASSSSVHIGPFGCTDNACGSSNMLTDLQEFCPGVEYLTGFNYYDYEVPLNTFSIDWDTTTSPPSAQCRIRFTGDTDNDVSIYLTGTNRDYPGQLIHAETPGSTASCSTTSFASDDTITLEQGHYIIVLRSYLASGNDKHFYLDGDLTVQCDCNTCGDGIPQCLNGDSPPICEDCDDGNLDNSDACTTTCEDTQCGDNFLQSPNSAGVFETCEPFAFNPLGNCRSSGPNACTYCGDGNEDAPTEDCEDGNSLENDRCNNNCLFTNCGDGIRQTPNGDGSGFNSGNEQCDHPSGNSDTIPDRCRTDCRNPYCGDNVKDPSNNEDCDDANTNPADECTASCEHTTCGDLIVQSPNGDRSGFNGGFEQCEVNTDCVTTVPQECVNCGCVNICGNGRMDPGETCDPGSAATDPLGNCRGALDDNPCTYCGDDTPQTPSEVCDEGAANGPTGECDGNCVNTYCGDNVVQTPNGWGFNEDCDREKYCSDGVTRCIVDADCGVNTPCSFPPIDLRECANDCTWTTCGDGIVQNPNGMGDPETCEAHTDCGNTSIFQCNFSNCSCRQICGNGFLDPGESCDPNDPATQAGCRPDCTKCGDNNHDIAFEDCDDGPLNGPNNRCDAMCQFTTCGDGNTQTPNGDGSGPTGGMEQCDDGPLNGPTAECTTNCTFTFCGDDERQTPNGDGSGINSGNEQCDDGPLNQNNRQCLPNCANNVCGDGFELNTPSTHPDFEECDDGSALNSDTTPDACRTDCRDPWCGDSINDSGETCDTAAPFGTTNNPAPTGSGPGSCRTGAPAIACSFCGDGNRQSSLEECDQGASNADNGECKPLDCTWTFCGDGVIQAPNGKGLDNDPATAFTETCEDGLDTCTDGRQCVNCSCVDICGNGMFDPLEGETCDNSVGSSNTGYEDGCRPPGTDDECTFCGDGDDTQIGEECDEGASNSDTGSCTTQCKTATCGDGLVHDGIEECDEGVDNAVDGICDPDCNWTFCGDSNIQNPNGKDNSGNQPGFPETCDEGASNSITGTCNLFCQPTFCGDDEIQSPNGEDPPISEQCDDAALNSDSNGCTADCQNATCGDGHVRDGDLNPGDAGYEECDEGGANDPLGSCNLSCELTTCGDDDIQPMNGEGIAEECDDGPLNDDTAECSSGCKETFCGDGITQAQNGQGTGGPADDGVEECDGESNCTADCKWTVCGNNIPEFGEECHDGTLTCPEHHTCIEDECICDPPLCGNEMLDTVSETCDYAADPLTADNPADPSGPRACRPIADPDHCTYCGDTMIQTTAGEECDDPGFIGCSDDCLEVTYCGDGDPQSPNDIGTGGPADDGVEECDNGEDNSDTNPDACRENCVLAHCGDTVTDSNEECDLGDSLNSDTGTCNTSCDLTFCGDDEVQTPNGKGLDDLEASAFNEECDEGVNNSDTGTCKADCTKTFCGDGIQQSPNGDDEAEACDDPAGNSDTSPDTCREDCSLPRCGDTVTDPGNDEDCDDGDALNSATGQCDLNCKDTFCGDGITQSPNGNGVAEECDGEVGCNTDCTWITSSSVSSQSSLSSQFSALSSAASSTSTKTSSLSALSSSAGSFHSAAPSSASQGSQGSSAGVSSAASASSHGSSAGVSSASSQTSTPTSSSLSSQSSADSSVSTAAGHTICNSFDQCEAVPGSGTDECSQDADCVHTVCNSDICETVSGPGVSACGDSRQCITGHLECVSGVCLPVPGEGDNLCNSLMDCCIQDGSCPQDFHTECVGLQCVTLPGAGTDECSDEIDCAHPLQHTECDNRQCITVDGPGSNECIGDEQCRSMITHTVCDRGMCVPKPGPGTNECTTAAQCNPQSHLQCINNQCISVPGSGTNSCSDHDDCSSTISQSHLECIGLQCVLIAGPGATECLNESDCLTLKEHTECKNRQCITVNGPGTNECINASDCERIPDPGHLECRDEQCIPVDGAGSNECINDSDCIPRVTPHGECENGMCVQKTTPGSNECINDDDCSPPQTHLECHNSQCITVEGPGTNECINHSDCLGTPHTECQGGMCIVTVGLGTNECSNDDDCIRTIRGHTQCRNQQCITIDGSGPNHCINDSDCLLERNEYTVCADLQCILVPGSGENQCLNHDDCTIAVRSTAVGASIICGDGLVEYPEECDDGNNRDSDGCSSLCRLEVGVCGDGIIQRALGEQCEDILHSAHLAYRCENCRFLSRSCGDSTLDPGEECDRGKDNADSADSLCREDCSLQRCGDGILDSTEECDDGNTLNTDSCSDQCTIILKPAAPLEANITLPSAPPQSPNYQPLPYQIPLQRYTTPRAYGDTGPGAIAVIAIGSGLGYAYVRRRKKSER